MTLHQSGDEDGTVEKQRPSPPTARKVKKTSQKSSRKSLYQWHSWVGFHLAAIMSIILATGTIATLSNEIDWLIQHDMRVTPNGDKVSLGRMIDAVREAAPEHHLASFARMEGDHFAYRATLFTETGKRYFMHVNQWTGEVTGTTHVITVQRIFRDLHRYLFMPSVPGLPLVTSFAFILSISLYTGLKTSRNWITLATRIRFSKGARIAVGDAHKAVGLWSIWFFAVMIVTSLWYLTEFGAAVGGERFEPDRPKLSVERQATLPPLIYDAPVSGISAQVEAHFPDLRFATIFFPLRPQDAVRVTGYDGNPLLRERANQIFLDPETHEVIEIIREGEIGWGAYLNEMADPLHFGNFGGLPTKLIWFVFGLGMTGLSLTGVWLTWKRLKTVAPSRAQFATFPVLILSMVACYFWYERFQGVTVPDNLVAMEALAFEDVELKPYITRNDGVYGGEVFITASHPERRLALRKIVVSLDQADDEGLVSNDARLRVFGKNLIATARIPAARIASGTRMTIQVEALSGREWTFNLVAP
ncbi:MAG: PepSY-associated TM helix domain-containing protein [Pseudomonadota bacterium]